MDVNKYIKIVVNKHFGKPILIIEIRISVYDILNLLSNGMSKSDIVKNFTEISIEMINTCLFFVTNKEKNIL